MSMGGLNLRTGRFLFATDFPAITERASKPDVDIKLKEAPLDVWDRFDWIKEQPTFKTWFANKGPRILILNGNEPADGKRSPVTMWTTDIHNATVCKDTNSRPHSNNDVYLFWYCHKLPDKEGREAVLSLLCDLLTYSRAEHQVPDWQDEKGNPIVFKFADLLKLFLDSIRQQLNYTAVWVVIDNITLWTGNQRTREMQELFDRLAEIAQVGISKETRYSLRLAITSPTATQIAANFRDAKVINVPNINEFETQQPSTKR